MNTYIEIDNKFDKPYLHDNQDLVKITVDGVSRRVKEGVYIVSKFKALIGVGDDKELDVIRQGELIPLCDNDQIKVKEGMVFISHPRTGCSS